MEVEAKKRDSAEVSDQYAPYEHNEFEPKSFKRARNDEEMNQDSSNAAFELESDEAIDTAPRKAGRSRQK